MFAVFDRQGDIYPDGMGEQGIFHNGTRHLSEARVCLWNERPLLLSSTIEPNNFLFSADLANLDVSREGNVVIHRGTLHVLRSRFLWRGVCFEEFRFCNYGMESLSVPLSVRFDADFADIFEVRGMARESKGRLLPPESGPDFLVLGCDGLDGIERRTRIQVSPPPREMLEREMKFRFDLQPKEGFNLTISIA